MKCLDCGKEISFYSVRCRKCYYKNRKKGPWINPKLKGSERGSVSRIFSRRKNGSKKN